MRLTKTKPIMNNDPLSQVEAKVVADIISLKGAAPKVHWTTLWRMTPGEISEKYPVTVKDVIIACKRKVPA